MKCNKRVLDKIGAMLVIAKSQSRVQKNFNRGEIRYYYCKICMGYHTTKSRKKEVVRLSDC